MEPTTHINPRYQSSDTIISNEWLEFSFSEDLDDERFGAISTSMDLSATITGFSGIAPHLYSYAESDEAKV